MIVIIPEGIEAIVSSGADSHSHSPATRGLIAGLRPREPERIALLSGRHAPIEEDSDASPDVISYIQSLSQRPESHAQTRHAEDEIKRVPDDHDHDHDHEKAPAGEMHEDGEHAEVSTFYLGLSMVLGFVLMFLIDRIPRHAVDRLRTEPPMRHVSLHNLGSGGTQGGEEEGFLSSLAPPPKQSRGFATTTGLVIHAAADGIAMGAGATTSDTQLGLIIFVAIMLHKAPAAFGLSTVLLKQGLSKRAARGHLLVFSLAAPFGALSTWAIVALLGGGQFEGPPGKWWTGILLLFSAGTFL